MRKVIQIIYYILMVLLLATVIISWVPALYQSPIGSIIRMITDPVLNPIRSIIGPVVGFDLSVLIVWLVLRFIYGILMRKFPEQGG